MKLPNGFGSVYKLSGKRRHPWAAVKTFGWKIDESTGSAKQIQKAIGYFSTRQEAMTALVNFNENPYDLNADNLTFSQVYERWTEQYFPTLSNPSSIRTVTAAYRYCSPIYDMRMKDIRATHLDGVIRDADVGNSTKARIKSVFNLMYRYALKNEIVDKNYAELCDTVKKSKPQIVRIPFSDDEIEELWNNISFPFVDMVLIGIYSGWRPQELAILKTADVDIDQWIFRGGLKTDSGKNRIVPIHPIIQELVKKNYDQAAAIGSDHLFNDQDGQQGTFLTYDKYRKRFAKIMTRLEMEHRPHDTRHTFITKAKEADMNEYILKMIVGHAVKDITEYVYTHRTLEDLKKEMLKITK